MVHSSQVQFTRDGRTLVVALGAAGDLSSEHPSPGTPPVEARFSERRPSAEPLFEARPFEPEPADLLPSVVRPPEPRPSMIADALESRPCRSRLPPAAALVKLDREIHSITLWALRASLSSRDPRRLGHGNEGLTAARDAHPTTPAEHGWTSCSSSASSVIG